MSAASVSAPQFGAQTFTPHRGHDDIGVSFGEPGSNGERDYYREIHDERFPRRRIHAEPLRGWPRFKLSCWQAVWALRRRLPAREIAV